MQRSVLVLAAGKGTRMKSRLPKVLQVLGDRPLLAHVLDTARSIGASARIVIIGHEAEHVRQRFAHEQDLVWVEQTPQLGTGHAVQCALPVLPQTGQTLILYGDVPLTQSDSLLALLAAATDGLALMTLEMADPSGYGRIIRAQGRIERIVEQKDASAQELAVREVNTGIMAVDNALLHALLPQLRNDNAQGEYYLTDLIALAVARGVAIHSVRAGHDWEVQGVNDKLQLAQLERTWQQEQARRLLLAGLTLRDPARFDLRGSLTHGLDCEIDVDVVIEGQVVLGDGVRVGAGCVLRDAWIGSGCQLRPYTLVDGARLGEEVQLGPFSRLRPGAELADRCHVGNFVEIKNSRLGRGSKANHLSYLGDAIIGSEANIGAGTITCNYDGVHKHITQIGDGAFIGSNTALVAPVRVGDQATTGAGSVITRDVAAGRLAVARARQQTIENWRRPQAGGAEN